jgi:hypothetical protein
MPHPLLTWFGGWILVFLLWIELMPYLILWSQLLGQ